ncbi:hypothetical protein EVAR_78194_1 [Eumeta japonica]|uniref:Uncharacterized protein n=1 Tax=Eumeta variegata TaxID=151549 RepID=A0A4C1V0P5_EUMVA|nr:hypothetical protein EVAR_78194_1 [Eumeta japonica]
MKGRITAAINLKQVMVQSKVSTSTERRTAVQSVSLQEGLSCPRPRVFHLKCLRGLGGGGGGAAGGAAAGLIQSGLDKARFESQRASARRSRNMWAVTTSPELRCIGGALQFTAVLINLITMERATARAPPARAPPSWLLLPTCAILLSSGCAAPPWERYRFVCIRIRKLRGTRQPARLYSGAVPVHNISHPSPSGGGATRSFGNTIADIRNTSRTTRSPPTHSLRPPDRTLVPPAVARRPPPRYNPKALRPLILSRDVVYEIETCSNFRTSLEPHLIAGGGARGSRRYKTASAQKASDMRHVSVIEEGAAGCGAVPGHGAKCLINIAGAVIQINPQPDCRDDVIG